MEKQVSFAMKSLDTSYISASSLVFSEGTLSAHKLSSEYNKRYGANYLLTF